MVELSVVIACWLDEKNGKDGVSMVVVFEEKKIWKMDGFDEVVDVDGMLMLNVNCGWVVERILEKKFEQNGVLCVCICMVLV